MAESGGVSGVAVGLAAAGGLLMYAGIQGISPLEALRDVTSGKTKSLGTNTVAWTRDPSRRSGGDLAQVSTGGGGGGFGGALVAAARRRRAERYSQSKRWKDGYSDCSSYIGKSLRDIGIQPPGASVTGSYLTWSKLRTVPRAQMQEGDLLCGAGHIALATGPGTAIGQQNSRSNVQEGPADKIMWGQPSWVVRRYVGAVSSPGTAAT